MRINCYCNIARRDESSGGGGSTVEGEQRDVQRSNYLTGYYMYCNMAQTTCELINEVYATIIKSVHITGVWGG